VALTFPAGAVATPTTFTLQPVENRAPGAVGAAFELSPSVELAQPVAVNVLVPAAALLAGGSTALSAASQGADGGWSAFQSGVEVQPQAQARAAVAQAGPLLPPDVVSARLLFLLKKLNRRAIAVYSRLTLGPRSPTVHTSKNVQLAVAACYPVPEPPAGAGEDDLAPLPECKFPPSRASSVTAAAGTLFEGSVAHFTYTAPAQVPSPNPVVVTVRYDHVAGTAGSVIVVGQVTVLGDVPPSYSGPVTFDITMGGVPVQITGTADVLYTLSELLPGDLTKYVLTQNVRATVTPTVVDCDPLQVTIPTTGTLILFDKVRQGPGDVFADKYQFAFGGGTVATFSCFNPRMPTQIPVAFQLSTDCSSAADGPSWTDYNHLTGQASPVCTDFGGTLSWDLSGP
jgi:hypothetical protein